MNGAEVADSERSGIFPCASFLGSRNGPDDNVVYAYHSEDTFSQVTYINSKGPGETYLVGGNNPSSSGKPIEPGPYVARVHPITGARIWQTYLENANVNNVYIAGTNLNILEDGSVVTAWDHQIVKLDADTGAIVAHTNLPTEAVAPEDANYKHVTVAPDGTLILKDQNRPAGCLMQSSGALIQCPGAVPYDPDIQADSDLVAVDPDTLEVVDNVVLPEESTTPHIVTEYQGQIAIYISANINAYRYFWDPDTGQLTQDESWVVSYLEEGQSTGDAPTVMGDWICIQTNGIGAEVPSTVTCINQDDPTNVTSIAPFGELESGQTSFAPPKAGADPENNMLYSADAGVGQVAGIEFDPNTGEMTTKWTINAVTFAFQPVIGPPDERVLLLESLNTADLAEFEAGFEDKLTYWDAGTGELLAESDYVSQLSTGELITPTYGGRVYWPTSDGFYILQAMPKSSIPPVPELP